MTRTTCAAGGFRLGGVAHPACRRPAGDDHQDQVLGYLGDTLADPDLRGFVLLLLAII
jgi:hypothetical protein